MAREVHERENLLRDATALTTRVQLEIESVESPLSVFAGFRPPGALSLYFGNEPVYHFNSQSQLRRAYVEGRLIKVEAGRLIAMKRLQTESLSELLRHDLTDSEQDAFCQEVQRRLFDLNQTLRDNRFRMVGQVPEEGNAVELLENWLENYRTVTVADAPGVS